MELISVIGLVVTIIFGVGGLFFGLDAYRKTRRKKLGWKISAATPLFSLRPEVQERIEVRYKGSPIEDAHLVQFLIKNQGSRDIVPGDFVEGQSALLIKFRGKGKMLEILDIERSSKSLKLNPSISVSNTPTLAFTDFFLQSGEWFSVSMIVQKYQGVDVSARITDCDILNFDSRAPLPWGGFAVIGIMLAISVHLFFDLLSNRTSEGLITIRASEFAMLLLSPTSIFSAYVVGRYIASRRRYRKLYFLND